MADKELERIMRKKLEKYMELAKKAKEKEKEKREAEEAKERFLRKVLTEDAYDYLLNLRSSSRRLAEQIENTIIYLFMNGYVSPKLTKLDLMYLKRRITGEKGKIYVSSREGTFSFEEFIRKSS